MRIFLLDSSFSGESIYTLRSREKQYLNKVLRLSIGLEFTAKDKDENYYKATLIDQDTLSLIPTDCPEETLLDNLSGYKGKFAEIHVYFSLLKGKKNEMVVKALTEIGVASMTIVNSQFVQEKNFNTHQMERLETIIKEAVQQSGAVTPMLSGPIPFSEAIEIATGDCFILHQSKLIESISLKKALENCSIDKPVSIFVGPEGGFSDQECEIAINNNVRPVLMNTNILRAETASIYASAAIQTLLQG